MEAFDAVDTPPAELCLDSLGGWQDFELLPPSYRARRNAQRAIHRWSSVILILLTVTLGSAAALWARGQRVTRQNAELVAQAEPIRELRQATRVIEAENLLLEKWCLWVESAKPDDCVLQTLAAVALATQNGDPLPPQKHLDVQSIEVKLPLEYDLASENPPTWAAPKFSMTVTANSRDVLMPWNDRLEKTGRLENVKLTAPGGVWHEALIQVNATPLATRTVP